MIRNIASYNKTDCANQQLTTQATHEENKITCACDDNVKEISNNLS